MKWICNINGVIELITGMVLIMRPDLLFDGGPETAPHTLVAVKFFGVMGAAFGGISLVLGRFLNEPFVMGRVSLIIIMYHLLISFQCYGAYYGGYLPNLGAFGVHLTLAVFFVILYLRSKK
ncbi:MAG: hypothetical protein IPN79_14480 [Saprospiraceae bacterium]|nr:hypothetical protein [Saprospiraceae bacterium]